MSIVKRIAALTFIFLVAAAAWVILGATIFARTYGLDDSLKTKVASTWGSQQSQAPPTAYYLTITTEKQDIQEFGRTTTKMVETSHQNFLPLESTVANVSLDLEHRQKGLLWYATYKVAFAGQYVFRNNTAEEQEITFSFPFPAEHAIYDDVLLTINDVAAGFSNQGNTAQATARVNVGKTVMLKVAYRSQGLDRWDYTFGGQIAQVHDFHLNMSTNFKDIDFPDNTISPTVKHETANGWDLQWEYKNLLSGYEIGMAMPEKLQPGPLAGRISFFAPVSLFFFFFLVFIISTMRGIDLHPMNYFFLAAAFFAFHLLMAYLVDHISIHLSFLVSSLVSLALVISYLRLVTGMKFAAREAGLAQLVYLVLFSYAFFFKGFTGLAVTIGSVLTLFVVMQMTGRINWNEKFTNRQKAKVEA